MNLWQLLIFFSLQLEAHAGINVLEFRWSKNSLKLKYASMVRKCLNSFLQLLLENKVRENKFHKQVSRHTQTDVRCFFLLAFAALKLSFT